MWLEKEEESTDKEESKDLSSMLPLEGDDEAKEGKGLKVLSPSKLLTWLPKLLSQIKAGNNSYKYYISCISIIKSIKKFTTI